MRPAILVVRLSGLVALLIGAAIWIGHRGVIYPVHMLAGIILVVGLWTVAILAARRRTASTGRAAAAIVLGLVIPAFGMMQTTLMPGASHWLVRIVHLLLGLGGMGMAESLARPGLPPADRAR